MNTSKKIVLRFPPQLAEQPIVYRLVKDYNLQFNILKASITPKEEGLLVLELTGTRHKFDEGIRFLTEIGLAVQPLTKDVTRKESRCTHCGACVTICPAGAFVVNPQTRRIDFIKSKCIACELCINACPVRAMELRI